jgi:endo-1,4-beta-xylanase
MKKIFVICTILMFLLFIVGCAKAPTTEQLQKVEEVKREVASVPSVPNALVITTFESGKEEGWTARGDNVKILVTDKEAHTGKYSLYVSGRSNGWHGAQIQLKDILKPGKVYSISVWVMQKSGSSQYLGLTMQRKYDTDSNTQYDWIKHENNVPSGKWVELSGTYEIPANVSILDLTLYVEAPSNTTLDFYIDDLVIVEGKTGFRITPELYELVAKNIK